MKMQGNYYDHPTLGLTRVPDTVMLNRYEYVYDPDLGFLKKIKKVIKKVTKPIVKPIEKLGKKTGISKLIPKELKGGVEKPLALAAAGYGLYTLGAGSIMGGAAKAGSAVASGAAKVGGAALTAAKVAAPVIATGMVTAAKTAGQVGTAVLEAAPAYLQAQQAIQQQQAQAEINRIETDAHIQALQAQAEHEAAMNEIMQARAQTSIPPQAIVYPGGGGGPPSMNLTVPGQAPAAASGMNTQTVMLVGAGIVAVALMMGRK